MLYGILRIFALFYLTVFFYLLVMCYQPVIYFYRIFSNRSRTKSKTQIRSYYVSALACEMLEINKFYFVFICFYYIKCTTFSITNSIAI